MILLRQAKCVEILKEELLRACIFNLTYDRQCEHERSAYLARLIAETGGQEEFFAALALRFAGPRDSLADIRQLFSVLGLLAANLGASHKAIVRQSYSQLSGEEQLDCMDDFVRLDGIEALVECAEQIEDHLKDEGWRAAGLLEALAEREGRTEGELLRKIGADYPQVPKFVAHLEADRQSSPAPNGEEYDFDAIRSGLLRGERRTGAWQRTLSEAEWNLLAEDLAGQSNPNVALHYLRLFARRAFPLGPQLLVRWVDSGDSRASWAALRALGRVHSPLVRKMALQRIGNNDPVGVRLLLSNFQSGDLKVIDPMFSACAENEVVHDLGLAVLDLMAENEITAAEREPALLQIYNRTPCSMCRYYAASGLVEDGRMPEWMAEECQFDAEPDTAKLV